MRAIEIRGGAGPAEALHVVDARRPEPVPGEILIRVEAAGVNRPDLLQRDGRYPPPPGAPTVLGLEVAGEVVIGAGRWTPGDRVCALLGGGGYAEYATCDARHALPIPAGLSTSEAAALPETVFTVWTNVFERGALRPGETLLLHGATSGIGLTAIPLAKAHGARVIAAGRGADKAARALQAGADLAIDATTQDFVAEARAVGGADVILDMVGAELFARNLDALNPDGRLVVIATQGGALTEVDLLRLMLKRQTVTGSTLRARSADEKARLAAEVECVVWPWIEQGRFRPAIDATFPLDRAADAHRRVESGRHAGKVVLTT